MTAATIPAHTLLAETLELGKALLEVLEKENGVLAEVRFEALPPLVQTKNRLAVAYGFKLEEIRDAGTLPSDDPVLLELRALNERLEAVAQENAAALQGAIEGNQKLLDAVLHAAGQHAAPPAGYGRVGVKGQGRPGVLPAAMMVTTKL